VESPEQKSEFLKMVQYLFAIPAHNATLERIFSLMKAQWTEDRNKMCVETVKHLLLVKFNYTFDSCKEFHKYCINNKNILQNVKKSAKYNQ
jgi:hypothetical protein